MPSDVNVVALTARLAADPELKGENKNVLALRVASNKRGKVDGEYQDIGQFFDVTVFGKPEPSNRAAVLYGMLAKGSRVAIAGQLEQRSWEQDGQKRYAVGIIANEVTLLDKKDDAPKKADAPAESADAPSDGDGPGYF
jgi:single-strand DNA-binding protein